MGHRAHDTVIERGNLSLLSVFLSATTTWYALSRAVWRNTTSKRRHDAPRCISFCLAGTIYRPMAVCSDDITHGKSPGTACQEGLSRQGRWHLAANCQTCQSVARHPLDRTTGSLLRRTSQTTPRAALYQELTRFHTSSFAHAVPDDAWFSRLPRAGLTSRLR